VRASNKRLGGLLHSTYRCRACKRHYKHRTRLWYVASGLGILLIMLLGVGLAWMLSQPDTLDETAAEVYAPEPLAAQVLEQARKGDPAMQLRAGLYYWSRADYHQAFPWLKAAAGRGLAEAKYYLGLAYLDGRGTIQNYRYAQEHFEYAAKRDHHEAQYTLGILYRDGLGVQGNRELAYAWLNIAASRGHQVAALEREKLAATMPASGITAAQEISIRQLREIDRAQAVARGAPDARRTGQDVPDSPRALADEGT
jgi:hypothetical protein